MRTYLIAAAILVAMVASAMAGPKPREIHLSLFGPAVTLPQTDADLARSNSMPDRPTQFDRMVGRLGVKDGAAELFEYNVLSTHRGADLTGALGGNGVVIRLQW